MPSWCSLLWGWSETAFIWVVAVQETLLPLKNTLAANNQEGQDERKPTNLWQVTVIPQLMKLGTKLIDMFWMDCEKETLLARQETAFYGPKCRHGDMIDWKALLAKYAEERRCVACNERKQKAGFTVGQWRRADEERICRECSHRRAAAGTPWQCNVCKLWQPEKAFSEKHQHNRCSFYRVCRRLRNKETVPSLWRKTP